MRRGEDLVAKMSKIHVARAERAAHVGGRGFSGCPPLLHWLAVRPVPAFWAVGACAFGRVFLVGPLLPFFFFLFETFLLPIRFIKKYLLFNIVTARDGEYCDG